jgi:hypothetical protein
MWRGLETGERRAFSESFQPFRAEPYKFYIYRQYTNIDELIIRYLDFWYRMFYNIAKDNVVCD